MEISVLILVATSLQARIIFCNNSVADVSAVGFAGILRRLAELEKHDTERENERRQWKEEMYHMQSKLAFVLTENKQLKDELSGLNDRITDIEKENKELGKQLMNVKTSTFENQVNRIKQDDEMQSTIHQILGGLNKPTESDNESHMITNHVRNARDAQNDQRIRRADSELDVAFYASLQHHLQHAGANQNVAFKNIFMNVGNAYNSHAGDFRAPVAGTYVFSTSLMTFASHTTHYYFARNGMHVGNIYVRGQESPNASTSMTIVLRLNAGDDVAVRNIDLDEMLHGHNYSAFSGFLLQQDFTVSAGTIIG